MRSKNRWGLQGGRVALVAILTVAFLNVPIVGAPEASAVSAQFTPIDDTYADANTPDTVRGSLTVISVDASPVRVSYLKFNVSGVGTPASVAVQINAESSGDGFDLYAVADTSWTESTLTFNNAPPLGALLGSVGAVKPGTLYQIDVSSYVTGDGIYAFGIATTDTTVITLGSKEGGNAAVLHVPAPPSPSPFLVTRSGSTYTAASQSTTSSYTGSLKSVVESAVTEMNSFGGSGGGGGTITFAADTFDLGSDHFEFDDISDIVFEGQGVDSTVITNNSSAPEDTELFDIVTADALTLRDFTVAANGAPRATSDALDFDDGSNIVIERVKITASRGRGIVFDGKGPGWSSGNNTITDCVITGIPGDGIELLAAHDNTISGCLITDVGGHGIQLNKSSTTAPQPNKKSNGNLITGNTIDNSGQDGININSSDGNRITNNIVTNSSDDVPNKDGIRLSSNNGITCDDNEIEDNTSTDNQVVKTQRYGINISSSLCNRTVLGANSLAGNLTGEINDLGTDTQDIDPPSVPTSVTAVALNHFEVDVSWNPSTDNVAVTGYTIYRDGTPLTTVGPSTLSYLDRTVAPSTTYDYTIEAFDAAANTSGQSSPDAQATTPPPAGTLTGNPTDDAYVSDANPTTNYGSSLVMRVDSAPLQRSYLRFDVAGVVATVTSVTLRVYAETSLPAGFEVRGLVGGVWDESTLTFATAPTPGSVLAASGAVSAGGYVDIDVSSYVTGNGQVDFVLTPLSGTALRMSSSESVNPPQLVVVQAVPPPPVNVAPVVSAGSDDAVTLPASASLDGTVTDDGLPSGSLSSLWTKFSGPGTVTFGDAAEVDTSAGFSTDGVYVLRLTADDGALTTSDDVTITVNPVPRPPPTDYFVDDDGSIFEDEINAIAAVGITLGCAKNLYCPDGWVTRGQIAAYLARAFDLRPSGIDYFVDDDGSIFEDEINAIAAAGITLGCAKDLYCPDGWVTRGQTAAYLARGLGL